MPASLPSEFVGLLNRQRGIFSAAQAADHGLTRASVRANLDARRWQRISPRVFAAFTGPLNDEHRAWVAVINTGPLAALSHESAAYRHGLIAEPPPVIHVVVPTSRRPAARAGITVHRTRTGVQAAGFPPVVTVADTLCDLAGSGWRSDRLSAVVALALQRRLVAPGAVERRLDERASLRGSRELRLLVADAASGAHSALEVRYLRDVERRHGLPTGQRQARAVRGGRTSYRDVFYADHGVVVELDGQAYHDNFAARLRDSRRDLMAAAEGEVTVRFGWWDVAGAACEVAEQVGTLLVSRGWAGSWRRCRRCPR